MTAQTLLGVALIGVAVYFTLLTARTLHLYLLFRRIRDTALVTWPGPRPPHFPFLVTLGVVSGLVAVLNAYLGRPAHHVFSQGVMSAYFIVMVPLTSRIERGLYRDGVWGDRGFLLYGRIGRMAFVERPEVVLVMVPRGRSGALRLPVPVEEYGTVRKLLEEKIRAHVLQTDSAILGL